MRLFGSPWLNVRRSLPSGEVQDESRTLTGNKHRVVGHDRDLRAARASLKNTDASVRDALAASAHWQEVAREADAGLSAWNRFLTCVLLGGVAGAGVYLVPL